MSPGQEDESAEETEVDDQREAQEADELLGHLLQARQETAVIGAQTEQREDPGRQEQRVKSEDVEGPFRGLLVTGAQPDHAEDEESDTDEQDADIPQRPDIRRVEVGARLEEVVQLIECEAKGADVEENLPEGDVIQVALQGHDVKQRQEADEEDDLERLHVARHTQATPWV